MLRAARRRDIPAKNLRSDVSKRSVLSGARCSPQTEFVLLAAGRLQLVLPLLAAAVDPASVGLAPLLYLLPLQLRKRQLRTERVTAVRRLRHWRSYVDVLRCSWRGPCREEPAIGSPGWHEHVALGLWDSHRGRGTDAACAL